MLEGRLDLFAQAPADVFAERPRAAAAKLAHRLLTFGVLVVEAVDVGVAEHPAQGRVELLLLEAHVGTDRPVDPVGGFDGGPVVPALQGVGNALETADQMPVVLEKGLLEIGSVQG